MANPDSGSIESELPAISHNEPIEILREHNKSAPLLRLPLELLLFVLHLVVADGDADVTQRRLMALLSVCSGLGAVVTAAPEFWTYASLSWPKVQIRRVLALSRPGTLRLVVPADWCDPGTSWNAYSAESRPRDLVAAFPYVAHLKIACIETSCAMRACWNFNLAGIHSTALRTLELGDNCDHYPPLVLLELGNWHKSWCTTLTTLTIGRCRAVQIDSIHLPSLRTFKLSYTSVCGHALHQFLTHTPTLEAVVLFALELDLDYPATPAVALPYLQNLTLYGDMPWVAPLLAALPDPQVMLKVDAYTVSDDLDQGRPILARCKAAFWTRLELGVADLFDMLTFEGPRAYISVLYSVRTIDPLFDLVVDVLIGPYGVRGDVLHDANFLPNARTLGLYLVNSAILAEVVEWVTDRAKRGIPFRTIHITDCTKKERKRLIKAFAGVAQV
jgi:hypothetical protein